MTGLAAFSGILMIPGEVPGATCFDLRIRNLRLAISRRK